MIDDGVCETGLEATPRKFANVSEHFFPSHPRDRLMRNHGVSLTCSHANLARAGTW